MTARIDRHNSVRVANASTVICEGRMVVCGNVTDAMRIAQLLDSHGWTDDVGEMPLDPFVETLVVLPIVERLSIPARVRRWWS